MRGRLVRRRACACAAPPARPARANPTPPSPAPAPALARTGYEAAVRALSEGDARYAAQVKRVDRQQHMASTLDFPAAALAETARLMRAVADDAEHMRALWELAREAREFGLGEEDDLAAV